MSSIGELFPKCRKLAYDARQQLSMIQQQQRNGTGHVSVTDLYMVLEELNRQLDTMETLVLRETPSQREVWKQKIRELRSEGQTLTERGRSLETASNRLNGSYQRQREELLRRRRPGKDDESEMQRLVGESQSLENSRNAVVGINAQLESNLMHLAEQRQKLRGVNRVIAEIGNSLGVTQATMRIIERRDVTDGYLVGAGMVFTIIVIYVVWFVY